MDKWEFHLNEKAPCGVNECLERFHSRIEWVYHCRDVHPEYFKEYLRECGVCEITECSTKNSDECLLVADKQTESKKQ